MWFIQPQEHSFLEKNISSPTENAYFLSKQININLKSSGSSCHCNLLCKLQLRCHSLSLCSLGKAFCLAYPFHNMLFPSSRREASSRHSPGGRRKQRDAALKPNSHEIDWCHFEEKNLQGIDLYLKPLIIFWVNYSSFQRKYIWAEMQFSLQDQYWWKLPSSSDILHEVT